MDNPAMTEFTELASLDTEPGDGQDAVAQPRFTQDFADELNQRFARVPAAQMLRKVLTELLPDKISIVPFFGT